MFEDFSDVDKYLIYKSMLNSVRANSGDGFVNSDQGHTAYRSGASGIKFEDSGDHPDQNRLYKMMLEISWALKDGPDLKKSDLVLSWEKFCSIAVEAHDTVGKEAFK